MQIDQETQRLILRQRNVINNAASVDISDGSPPEAEKYPFTNVGERDSIRELSCWSTLSYFVHHLLLLLEAAPVVPPPFFSVFSVDCCCRTKSFNVLDAHLFIVE